MRPSKLFLDLDGVLVDFESGVYNIIKKYYHSVDLMNSLDKEEDKDNIIAMYEIMERRGKFKEVIAELLKHPQFKETLREIVSKDKSWWESLGWMPDGKELWEYIRKYNPIILSSDFDKTNSTEGKTKWVKNNLGPEVKVIIADRKGAHAEPNSLLVDDRQFVLDEFIRSGGRGFLHKSAENTIQQLEAIYSPNESFQSFKYLKSLKSWLND